MSFLDVFLLLKVNFTVAKVTLNLGFLTFSLSCPAVKNNRNVASCGLLLPISSVIFQLLLLL